jgi:signal transduction histidine kinase/ligand-binding sensor domain-containing protein/DNA-binding response OmpR family regulator
MELAKAGERPVISVLGIEQGLSNNSVTCAYQDHHGFMWFGTYDGLNRYDGYTFRIFRNQLNDEHSLPNNRISDITEDSRHQLWIGTRVGAGRYDPVTSSFTTIKFIPRGEKKPKKINAIVNDIFIDHRGVVFIGTDDNLLICNENESLARPLSFAASDNVKGRYQVLSVEQDSRQIIWVYVRDVGLCKYNPGSDNLEIVNTEIKNGICLRADPGGRLWMGTDDGLYEYSVASNRHTRKMSSFARIVQLSIFNNQLYISSDGNGIFQLDFASGSVAPLFQPTDKQILTSPAVNAVLKDIDGRIWIGTLRGGINILDAEKNRFRTIAHDPQNKNSLGGNVVISFCEDTSNNVWIGSDGNGITYWNRNLNRFHNYSHDENNNNSLRNNAVTDLLIDFRNELWVATWGGGVDRLNQRTGNFEHFNSVNTVHRKEDKNHFVLYQDKHNQLWTGTCLEGGLYRFNRNREKFELFDERLKNILTMSEDSLGNLWAGDFSSLIKMDPVHKNHIRYPMGYAVRAIYEDKNGEFWIGTEGGGLLLFNRNTGKYQRYTDKNGLTNNSILNILADKENNLWISTFNGLSRFNTKSRSFVNFSQSDGLQSNQFNYNAGLALRSGEFLFGGIRGLNIFYPDSISNRNTPLRVLLTDIKVDNVLLQGENTYPVKKNDEGFEAITLPFNKAVVAIDFVALNYSGSDKIKYAYYLEGWDKGWNYVGKLRTANYTRLNEGSYLFHVKAVDAAGSWTEIGESLKIVVLPPWYRSVWAYLFYSLLIGSMIYMYVQYKAQQARQAYEVALAKIETEKEKELNEKKLSFFTNVSHEFRAPLTLIIDPVKELLNHPEKKTLMSDLNIVFRNARRLLSLVDQLLLFRKADTEGGKLKLSTIHFYEFCHEVFTCFSHQAKSRSIDYSFTGEFQPLDLLADREKLEIILFNLLSNALKFTPQGGKVNMDVSAKKGQATIVISDSGPGIDPEIGEELFEKFYQVKNNQQVSHKGFGIGLYLVKQFAQAHHGTIRYESNEGAGSRFIFSFPVRKPVGQPEIAGIPVEIKTESKQPAIINELLADLEAGMEEDSLIAENQHKGEWNFSATQPEFVTEKKTVLLVDDNTGIRQYLSQIFAEKFLVYEAEDGEDGYQMAQRHVPDIIISDVIMGGMSGVEFCKKIKSDPDLNHIPVILLTATTASDVKLKGIECGAEDFITKPFEKDFLIARVDNILKNRNTLQQYFLDTVTLRKNKTKVSSAYRDFLDNCMKVVDEHMDDEEFTIKKFARKMGMSHSNLYKKVKSVSGLSINAFIRFLRLRKAALILLSTDTNISEAAFQVGISDPKYFREQFFKLFGMNPSDYIKKYKDSFNKDINKIS